MKSKILSLSLFAMWFVAGYGADSVSAQALAVEFQPNDHVVYIGNTLADRMQHDGWLETYLHALHPDLRLTFRNLGFPGDEVQTRPRSENFGSADQWLAKCEADVVLCFFGYNEALRGEAELAKFRDDFASVIDHMRSQNYNGSSPPRLVMFSPIAHEDLKSPHLPDGVENNQKLAIYTSAMQEICAAKQVAFVDLFAITRRLYEEVESPLTLNGIHLVELGNRLVAEKILRQWMPDKSLPEPRGVTRLREAVLDKNYHWFSRYRVVDGYNVYGGRSQLAWFDQSNADVMRREMEIFDVMTANRDQRVWALAKGDDLEVKDDNLPVQEVVKTNKPGPLPGGKWPYVAGKSAIDKMTIAQGLEVNLFASEEEFPRLVNPVQMAVDTDSRLWVAVWPSYPHWNPTEPRRDALLIFPDEDGNGEADQCIVFADELNSVTGFEFWGGGVLVASPPEIWFLKDTDGDDRADVKVRMLQGISSADTHHSANALRIGPDGWLYWSRGIFNVANFETPTKTYRSGASGVHRFNPRTFEVEFHFPIGPNPHGDVHDRWGYQFANDGTTGTGSYVNIGKGVGNKEWFQKRVRPVAANGILSSAHFPPENEGNFLICNTIGFLGVLQHRVEYDGADIRAVEIEPILFSSDENFRPSDVEVGGDGALYVSDWHNTLIGHMQHNMRDPNRDHEHGRVYRVTAAGRALAQPAKMRGASIPDVLQHLLAADNGTRYRARLELSGRGADEVERQVLAFAERLNPAAVSASRDESQALLESLWVLEEHRLPNRELLRKTFEAEEPRVRAAAIRTLGHWAGRIDGWEPILLAAARDGAALVRAEAAKAAVEFAGLDAAEVVFEVASRPTDPELDTVLAYATRQLDVDRLVRDAIASQRKLSDAALAYVLRRASIDQIMQLDKSEAVHLAILSRADAPPEALARSIRGLASFKDVPPLKLLLMTLGDLNENSDVNVTGFGELLSGWQVEELQAARGEIERLAMQATLPQVRRFAYAAWIALAGPDDAFLAASTDRDRLRDFLEAVPLVTESVRGNLYAKVAPLSETLPSQLGSEAQGSDSSGPGIQVEYYHPSAGDVAIETLDKMESKAVGIVPEITMEVPQLQQRDQFALRFTGKLTVPQAGRYVFFIASDDGSRLYLDDKLLIDNDGLHGMVERRGSVDLSAGSHRLVVTYFDNGGGDGLSLLWRGPGFDKQNIPASVLSVGGGETLNDVAIRVLADIPGHDAETFSLMAALVAKGRNRPAAISTLRSVSKAGWDEKQVRPLIDNLIGYLSAMPARYRTGGAAIDAIELTKALAGQLSADARKSIEEQLQNLDVRVIAIGTVPHRMIFDKELITVEAGKPVEFRFANIDAMPHNFAIVVPGALQEVGELAEATGRDADAIARHYIPTSDKVLLSSRLLQAGESQTLAFEAPTVPGVYPYVCTYPGHWRRMYGALYVVEDLEAFQRDELSYLAAHPLEIRDELLKLNTRSHEWTYEELVDEIRELPSGRSYEVGKELFKVASCAGCHQLGGVGTVFGPDLAKLDAKRHVTTVMLQSILEPSKEIDEKYQPYTFALQDGKVITGMIVDETAEEFHVIIDPLAKAHPTVVRKDEVEERSKSTASQMPQGLLSKLSREEILDLLAFVYAGGDEKHALFGEHHHH